MTEINHQEQDDYFVLIERVNSKGKYQKNIFCLFYCIWFITAFTILQIAFLLLPKHFQCPNIIDHEKCKQHVCSLPQSQWESYQSQSLVNSMATQFGRYHCQYGQNISTYKMTLFLGIFFGFIVFTYFSDNFGRRLAMILTWVTANIGITIVCTSYSIQVACFGLFLAGAGCESNIRVNLSIINQTVDNHLRQTYSLILQTAFGLAGVFVAIGYYVLGDWRLVNVIFCWIPASITLAIIIYYLEQTPAHLQSKGSKAILRSLTRIAHINGLQCKITEQDILKVMSQKRENISSKESLKKKLNIFDLFKYKSLKNNTVYLSIILFFLSSLYIGPTSTIDKFKQNIFILQVVLSLSDCIAYPIACYYIFNTQRKKAGLKCFAFCALFTLTAHFFIAPEHCDFCFQNVMKLILLFLSRYCISYYYGIVFLYIVQIYPQQIRSIGFGTVSAVGALGSTMIQKIFGYIQYHQLDPLLFMFLFCLICLYASTKLPQTHGIPLQIQIQQLKKKRMKKKYEPTLEQSYDDIQLSSAISNSRISRSYKSRVTQESTDQLPDINPSPQKKQNNSLQQQSAPNYEKKQSVQQLQHNTIQQDTSNPSHGTL